MEHQQLFRQFNPLSPTTRQTTRALQEIQSQQITGILVLDDSPPPQPFMQFQTPLHNNHNMFQTTPLGHNHHNNTNMFQTTPLHDNGLGVGALELADRMRWNVNFDPDLATPNPSPDEMVIQARGRRQVPLTFSPDINHTPLRQQMQRAKLSTLATRSPTRIGSRLLLPSQNRTSPRKRLTLSDTPPSNSVVSQVYTPSPDRFLKVSPLTKKVKLDGQGMRSVDPEVAMKGLSHAQLVDMFSTMMLKHPELREEVRQVMPTPDLTELETNLEYLKKNIYKAMPSARLESKTDSMAYNRVSGHLLAFKRALADGPKRLLEAQSWVSVVDYTVMAWAYVKATPTWDNHAHNNVRRACFKNLAGNCMAALKRGEFNAEQCRDIKSKLVKLNDSCSDEITACLKHLDHIINNGNEGIVA